MKRNQKIGSETKNFWKRNKAKICCTNFAPVGSETFKAKRSEFFFSRECAKRMLKGSRFASFCFEVKFFCVWNRCILVCTYVCMDIGTTCLICVPVKYCMSVEHMCLLGISVCWVGLAVEYVYLKSVWRLSLPLVCVWLSTVSRCWALLSVKCVCLFSKAVCRIYLFESICLSSMSCAWS
jgi:hypothetical protein